MNTARPARPSYYFSLDLWRGVACLMVIVYHATVYGVGDLSLSSGFGISHLLLLWTRYGLHGVTLFFVISGYCIAATAEMTARKEASLLVYMQRRVRRIFPPYWAAVALTSVLMLAAGLLKAAWLWTDDIAGARVVGVIAHPATLNRWQWLGTVSLTETCRTDFVGRDGPRWILGQAWTLC